MEEAKVLSRLRETCLCLPEVRETTKWGHPTFEAGKKMFAVLDGYGGRACIAFQACPERRPALLAASVFSRRLTRLATAGSACTPTAISTGVK
jgi:hypothetical protein